MIRPGKEVPSQPNRVVLASASQIRAKLLTAAKVPHVVDPAHVDEDEIKLALRADGTAPELVAETLAETKALQVSQRHADALVIGADQILALDDRLFDKPPDIAAARKQLLALRGKQHTLHAGICVVQRGQRIWHYNGTAHLTVRDFSDSFLDQYLTAIGSAACQSVGAYQLEGYGAQLFDRIDGDYFTILGLPLLPLLNFLRGHDIVCA